MASLRVSPKPPLLEKCEHDWKTQVKMIASDNDNYKGGRAAFKVKKCEKCKSIIYLDYKVERTV